MLAFGGWLHRKVVDVHAVTVVHDSLCLVLTAEKHAPVIFWMLGDLLL